MSSLSRTVAMYQIICRYQAEHPAPGGADEVRESVHPTDRPPTGTCRSNQNDIHVLAVTVPCPVCSGRRGSVVGEGRVQSLGTARFGRTENTEVESLQCY